MVKTGVLISAAVAAAFLAALAAGSFAGSADTGAGDAGGYAVVASDDSFVLCEARTGRAWVLQESQRDPGRFAWMLINRLEDERSSEEWRLRNRFRHTAEPPR